MKKYTKKHIRILTIYSHYSPRAWGKGCSVPYIRLRGKWLENAGFCEGKQICVIVEKNKVLIVSK